MPQISFAADIKPLFRAIDIEHMTPFGVELDERRKLSPAYFFHAFTTWCERATGLEMSDVGWQSRYLVQLALFGSRIGDRSKQAFRIGITRSCE